MAFMFLGPWPFRNRRVRLDEGDIVFSRLEIVDDDAREMWQLAFSYSIIGKLWMRVARLIGVFCLAGAWGTWREAAKPEVSWTRNFTGTAVIGYPRGTTGNSALCAAGTRITVTVANISMKENHAIGPKAESCK